MTARSSIWFYAVIVLALAGAVVLGASLLNSQSAVAQSALPNNAVLNGYAWSSNIGWIKLSSDTSDSSSFGVSIKDGVLDGYGWSPNVGWIQFGSGLLGPSGAGVSGGARFVNNALVGWARFCTVFASGCSGALRPNEQNGGWDGWLLLGGGSLPGGGVKLGADNKLSGYAWGGENLGWVDFSGVTIGEGFIANCSVSPTTIPVAGEATWTATATGGSGSYTAAWTLTGGTPGTGTGMSVKATYATAGTYTGRATITDGATSKTATCQANLTVGEGGDHVLDITIVGSGQVKDSNSGDILCASEGADESTETMCTITGFSDGEEVDLLAVPSAEVQFIDWDGDCTGTDIACSLTMNADKSVTATFEESQKFDISIKYEPGKGDMLVNYQTQNLDEPHLSSPAIVTITRRARVDSNWTGPITLTMPLTVLTNKAPDQPAPVVTGDCEDGINNGPISVSLSGQSVEQKVCVYFATDGEPEVGLLSPYAGTYGLKLTASAPSSSSATGNAILRYLDRRESEN
ncbi:MAG: hypothetical protein A2114_01490 [Candidatus Vogelbacteria bacterium GWA1_51_14]|uniref:PKD domain-containing protein n=1 Tax=Candidatus Vogelbacteria bacterium GWA1_51_14 TaxID=1802435 RepID=A0A1G2QBA3_9BACT|nr:MAG: hypothetical protein A2114_01490 [Candidatus Vogelbacteria bacterium GWA1_51_14]